MRSRTTGLLLLALATCQAHLVLAGSMLLSQNWPQLSPAERYEALRNYRQHEQLPEDNQRDVERRYQRWQQMSPDERERVRQNYDRLQQLPPQERDRLRRKYEKWRQQAPPR